MSQLDWIILVITLLGIILYGVYKSRGQTGKDSFILANKNQAWYTVLIGIMATQASAITFISGPGQAYTDGMRFVQYYFGLPLAMIVISLFFIPQFQKIKTYTAYQFLDQRFDRKTRLFTGILFLFSRGLSTGMSVLAPAIVLSAIFQWNIVWSCILTGGVLIIYAVTGGAQAIAATQKIQFAIIIGAMILAGVWIIKSLPEQMNLSDALFIAGKTGKLNVITTQFDWNDKFNLWSGVIGGFFLALSYFGTDQSQVGRYASGKDVKQARLGILMNGMVKIPMQFLILLLGALLFSLFLFQKTPLFFNTFALQAATHAQSQTLQEATAAHEILQTENQKTAQSLLTARQENNSVEIDKRTQELKVGLKQSDSLRNIVSTVIEKENLPVEKKDVNYIFLYFVQKYLPIGAVGLIFAIIFLASWSSISAALNALAAATLIDFHQLIWRRELNAKQSLKYARWYTLLWGIFSIVTAIYIAGSMGSLIEAVNILGSLFYGPILGIFIVAFFLKRVGGSACFWSVILAEIAVLIFFFSEWVSFLWLNVVGALGVVVFSLIFQSIFFQPKENK